MTVLYEDDALLGVDKPAGMLVVAGRGPAAEENTVLKQFSKQAGRRLFVVHRLDRDTSGVLLFAKRADAHRKLCGLFESRRVHKTYLAIVDGVVGKPGVIDKPIREFGSGRMGVSCGGKPSKTRYKPLESRGNASLLEVEPESGRRHQIRVHLHSIGHPVLGDPLYGKKTGLSEKAPRLMLHAWKLEFSWMGKKLKLTASRPIDFDGFLEGLRNHSCPVKIA